MALPPAGSFNDFESLQGGLVDFHSQAGTVRVEFNVAILRGGFTLEDVPKELITHLHIDGREKFRHGRIVAGHHQVVIVHLAGMGNHRHRVGFRERHYLAGLGYPADSIGIKLDVIDRPGVKKLAKAIKSELVLAPRDGNSPQGGKLA